MSKEDGGPAFPIMAGGADLPGMTLRDHFAAKAMQGMLAKPENEDELPWGDVQDDNGKFAGWKVLSKTSYEIADAMLEARK